MLAFLVATALAASPASSGTLIIVGGALDANADAVFDALIGAMPVESPDIVIVPAASGGPATSAQAFARDLERHGIAADRVAVVEVAVLDDPDTRAVDESMWRKGASDPREVAKLANAGAIWFIGGDQARIVATLVRRDGSDTPLLAAIRARLAAGAVVGGSSAGAAIMSRPMIVQGDSLGALWPQRAKVGEPLEIGHGLGFLRHGLVDQHFDTRARLGRLSVALSRLVADERIGFGVDENTALVIDLATQRARAIGAGSVTILDARHARIAAIGRFAISGIVLGLASGGDTIDLTTGAVVPAPYKRSTTGREYAAATPIAGGGMAVPAQSTAAVVGGDLIDNRRGDVVERVSVSGAYGVRYRFTKGADARGWWGRDPGGVARYAVTGIGFAIEPLRVAIRNDTAR